MKKRCVICGARTKGGATCDMVCTHARKNGVSRQEQMLKDMDEYNWSARAFLVRRDGRWRSRDSLGAGSLVQSYRGG
jgi:hypothetical protein